MASIESPSRYSSLSIGMHWFMLLLLAAVYACIELRELYPRGSDPREAFKMWHAMLGLSVFVLVWIRLTFRLIGPTPHVSPPLPAWQAITSKAVYVALYAIMIGMPLLGWLLLSAEGKPVPFFGLQLPALIAENKELAESIEEIHETVGTVGYFLVGLHAVAALFHHYIRRDTTLLQMLPGRKSTI